MATFYVVSPDYVGIAPPGTTLLRVSDPLFGTDNFSVTSGDTYILSSDLDADVSINQPSDYDSGNPTLIQIEGGNATGYTIDATAAGDMNIEVPDGNDASMVNIDGFAIFAPTAGLNVSVGDGASIGNIRGSTDADAITTGEGSTVGNINGSFGDDTITIGQNSTIGSINGSWGDDSVSVGQGATVSDVSGSIGADTITVDGGTITGSINSGSGDDTVTLMNGASVGGDISVGGIGTNTVVVMGGSNVGGTISGGLSVDNVTIQDSSVTGNILTWANDDNVVLNNAYIGGYVHQEIGDDSLTLAGTVTIDGVRNSPTGTRFVDASVDQFSGNDTITIMSGANVTTAGVINQGANSGIGLNEDYLEFNDQGDIDTYRQTLGQAGFWDEDGDGTYTYQYNDDLNDKPLGSATGSEGEFSYTGTSFINVDNTNSGWTCFTRGTMIETDRGSVAIEALRVDDLVMTRDNGLQPIRWIGSKVLTASSLAENENLRPIRIRQGALGKGIPSSDLLVSPQHRMLARSKIAQRMFGTDEVLVAAKQLCQMDGIDIAHDAEGIEYFHMLFDRHELVIANGAESESLYTGPEAIGSIGERAREEIFTLFPELRAHDYEPTAVRTLVSGRMGRKLAIRHKQNKKMLVRAFPNTVLRRQIAN